MPRTDLSTETDWRSGAELETLQLRARLLARIRTFFSERGVLEVDTPVFSRAGNTDPAIESFQTHWQGPGPEMALYLQTSPEFFMKRLLASGSGAIYQLCHVFRDGEWGRRHNPEFLLLEWYRPSMDHYALMDEIDALLATILKDIHDYTPARRLTYQQWFLNETGLDPWSDTVATFRRFAETELACVPETMPTDELDPWLDLLVSHWLEPRLDNGPLFIYDYPASQASLARVRQQPQAVAERFELYFNGVELANGFHELTDADEQQRRFEGDNVVRQQVGQDVVPMDEQLIAALRSGLPDCAGVALGIDRLLMSIADLSDIDAAMPFGLQRV
ncbi:Translation elongation factor P Lys34--(R)-beta-lysine ligase [hydrothermal vent metagenome]|uniref:Translation elongation factor P Lys34--(R)-beta-lysine ligase n=1 Tax=hydrothermal vent metagenome TaxID=652676 RepID=A0A3B0XZQ4_9ZZZZ